MNQFLIILPCMLCMIVPVSLFYIACINGKHRNEAYDQAFHNMIKQQGEQSK